MLVNIIYRLFVGHEPTMPSSHYSDLVGIKNLHSQFLNHSLSDVAN